MPEWITPLLCPVWWAAIVDSLSRMTSRAAVVAVRQGQRRGEAGSFSHAQELNWANLPAKRVQPTKFQNFWNKSTR